MTVSEMISLFNISTRITIECEDWILSMFTGGLYEHSRDYENMFIKSIEATGKSEIIIHIY